MLTVWIQSGSLCESHYVIALHYNAAVVMNSFRVKAKVLTMLWLLKNFMCVNMYIWDNMTMFRTCMCVNMHVYTNKLPGSEIACVCVWLYEWMLTYDNALKLHVCEGFAEADTGERMFCYSRHVKGHVMKEYKSDPTDTGRRSTGLLCSTSLLFTNGTHVCSPYIVWLSSALGDCVQMNY